MHSWYPIELAAIEPKPASRPATGNLIYPGGRHLLSGEPEVGKGLFALALCVTETRARNTVAWIDRESDAEFVVERLRCFGVDGEELRRFLYFQPTDPVGKTGVADTIKTILADHTPTIVVFDAMAGLLDLHDLDGNKTADVERGYRAIIEPWRANGAATLVIDHVVKARGDRGRFAAGSERKLGAVDVHIGLEAIEPFSRGKSGRSKIIVHKDRHGFLARPRFGDFVLASDQEGSVTACGIEPAADEATWKPPALMAKVSAYLERQREPVSRNTIARDVKGKRDYLLAAISHLIADGFAIESDGARGAKLVASIKPYPDQFPDGGTAGNQSPGLGGLTSSLFPGLRTGNGNQSDQAELERLEGLAEELGL